MKPLSWPPTDLDAVCLPKALPVAVLDDLEKATRERQNGRGERATVGEKLRDGKKKGGRELGGGIHLIKIENMRRVRAGTQTRNAIYGLPFVVRTAF